MEDKIMGKDKIIGGWAMNTEALGAGVPDQNLGRKASARRLTQIHADEELFLPVLPRACGAIHRGVRMSYRFHFAIAPFQSDLATVIDRRYSAKAKRVSHGQFQIRLAAGRIVLSAVVSITHF